ncbi:MAG: MBL fold metallo-hydrolase [Candidatus Tectomicrobia bacterium]|nr:MBL fold metallo-hydrolase [Candidatus Tectomicrobia bacterium]
MCGRGIWAACLGLVLVVSMLGGYAPAGAAVAERKMFETTKVAEGVYSFRHVNHRNMFIVTAEGVIATDPINTAAAKAMMGEIRKVTDKPVKYVVYSHEHWDHIAGGKVFKDAGALFVAQERCLETFVLNPSPQVVMPDITFLDRHDIKLGGTTVELHYFGPNHGRCSTFVRLPKEKILFVVDLVTPNRVGFRGLTTTDPGGAVKSLRAVERLDFERIVPGHGPATAPAKAVRETREYYEDLIAAVREAMKKTGDVDKIKEMVKLPKYEKWGMYDRWLVLNVERIVGWLRVGQ